ncbi:hypothetical protein CB1_000527019 [Camelus ferus]|nr:hypothetical protein CB1_000527019 [Camelus ferus]
MPRTASSCSAVATTRCGGSPAPPGAADFTRTDPGETQTARARSGEEPPAPRPEAYPVPTQTSTREYFTFPASRSQDRAAPPQNQWPSYEEKPHMRTDSDHSSLAIQVSVPCCPWDLTGGEELSGF